MEEKGFGKGHLVLVTLPILLTHSTDNVGNTFFAITVVKWSCVIWSELWGARFCEWVRKTSLLSDTRPHSPSVLTLTSGCPVCFSRGPCLGHS